MKYATENHGRGSFFSEYITEEWDKLSDRDLARKLGDVAGCPVVERLTRPENSSAGRGSQAMIERYAEVAFWHGRIVDTVQAVNLKLASRLVQSVPRREGDVAGMKAYDDASIPDNHFEEMSPIGTIYGYALPRVLVEAIRGNDGVDSTKEVLQDRLNDALDALEVAAEETDDPYTLTAIFGEYVAAEHADSAKVLSHILPPGWLEEHGAQWMFDDMKDALQKNAPDLFDEYTKQ